MQIINRYIRNTVISATAFIVLVFTGVEGIFQLLAEVPNVGSQQYGVMTMLSYVLLNLPALVYMIFPIAAFIGCLIGLGRLAVGSELIVMRAHGLSILQITGSVVKAAIIMGVFVFIVGESIAPVLQERAQILKATAMKNYSSLDILDHVWLHHDNTYLYIDHVEDATHISKVSEFIVNHLAVSSVIFAPSAIKLEGQWHLLHAKQTIIESDHTEKKINAPLMIGFNFSPDKLQPFNSATLQGSVINLWHIVTLQRSAGLVTTLFELEFWQRMIQPFTTLVMICLGIPFAFGSLRSASAGLRLTTGILMGIAFYMLNRFFGPITLLYNLSPFLGALGPTLFFLMLYAYLLRRIS